MDLKFNWCLQNGLKNCLEDLNFPKLTSQIKNFCLMAQPNNPLHGKTLEAIVVYLVSYYGWEELGELIQINCFRENPSIQSSLKFLRRTPWARKKVELLYLKVIEEK